MTTLTGVLRGPFQSVHLGYWVAERWTRRGLGREMVGAAVEWALGGGRLHRVEAAIQPENEASLRLIRAIGFRHIGRAERYLHIAGAWRDHELFARVAAD
jgi:ribosomal-protein-alanine N-acetyltransferase